MPEPYPGDIFYNFVQKKAGSQRTCPFALISISVKWIFAIKSQELFWFGQIPKDFEDIYIPGGFMDKINDSVNRTDRLNLKSNYLKSTRKEKYSLQPSASLTVESAFVFPFFFLAIVILVLFLDLYRIQSVIQASLSQSSRELGMYAYCESDTESSPVGAVSSALCINSDFQRTERRSSAPDFGT